MSRSLYATYVGPIPHLKGERALIRDCAASLHLPRRITSRSILAQFNSTTAQRRLGRRGYAGRSIHKYLGFGWHRFDVRDFTLDAGVVTEVEQTCTACPSQFEGRLEDGSYFYARYRGARIRIGISPEGLLAALDKVLFHEGGDVHHTRRTVNKYDGYMTWDEMEPWFIKAIAAYRPEDWRAYARDHVEARRAYLEQISAA